MRCCFRGDRILAIAVIKGVHSQAITNYQLPITNYQLSRYPSCKPQKS
ncbi:MAG: hypothetical protein HC786_08985 [Richelia sp. CSU_2_1]|nr:hypothetical protein [Microcoleus sp. SU_5_6]NJL69654.1 hypothetical protein [Microcoleus sp. SM1_3_4]NJR22280.1 hypothetical protein [Richelia sp. CSU_2_1]